MAADQQLDAEPAAATRTNRACSLLRAPHARGVADVGGTDDVEQSTESFDTL